MVVISQVDHHHGRRGNRILSTGCKCVDALWKRPVTKGLVVRTLLRRILLEGKV